MFIFLYKHLSDQKMSIHLLIYKPFKNGLFFQPQRSDFNNSFEKLLKTNLRRQRQQKIGGNERIWTVNLLHATQALSQLSYTPNPTTLPKVGFGGDNRTWTGDPMLAKHVLSQLSYTPNNIFF